MFLFVVGFNFFGYLMYNKNTIYFFLGFYNGENVWKEIFK